MQPSQVGMTVVEVMISSLIMGITFLAVVTMVRQSSDIDYDGNAYFQAGRIANSILEKPDYHHSQYAAIPEDYTFPATDRPVIHVSDTRYINTEIRVQAGEFVAPSVDWGGTVLTYKRILVTITWNNGADVVTAAKWITQ
jgi:hypothetical protein